jgi:hypothetical protein
MVRGCLIGCAAAVAAFLLALGVAARPGGARSGALVGSWVEQGAHAELRYILRDDGRAAKEVRRQCIEHPEVQCTPLAYRGTWEAAGAWLLLRWPGGTTERLGWRRTGDFLELSGPGARKASFVRQLPPAEGTSRPPTLVGAWREGKRTLRLDSDGRYTDEDEDGAVSGGWRADASVVTLVPRGGADEITYAYRVRQGVLVLKMATGAPRTLRNAP